MLNVVLFDKCLVIHQMQRSFYFTSKCSGSRDRFILNNDTRSSKQERQLAGHKQEVFSLKWSPDRQLLASGGNDNRLLVWN